MSVKVRIYACYEFFRCGILGEKYACAVIDDLFYPGNITSDYWYSVRQSFAKCYGKSSFASAHKHGPVNRFCPVYAVYLFVTEHSFQIDGEIVWQLRRY